MEEQKRIFIGGVWDMFHIGHLNAIKKSKAFGDFLIVGVNSDELIYKIKKEYPIIPQEQRLIIIEACRHVDKAIIQTNLGDKDDLIREKITIYCTGEDWKNKSCEGLDWARKNLKVIYIPRTPGISSSMIRQKLGSKDFQL